MGISSRLPRILFVTELIINLIISPMISLFTGMPDKKRDYVGLKAQASAGILFANFF